MPKRERPARFDQPRWISVVDSCPACNYSLAGLPDPRRCPECGGVYGGGALVLSGIVGRAKGSRPGRRAAWVLVLAIVIPFLYAWPILVTIDPLVALVGGALGVGGVIALLATSPRERQGRERLAITATGAIRKPLRTDSSSDTAFVPFPPGVRVDLKRVSGHWARLGVRDPDAPKRVLLDAGFSCNDEHLPMVEQQLAALLGSGAEAGPLDGN